MPLLLEIQNTPTGEMVVSKTTTGDNGSSGQRTGDNGGSNQQLVTMVVQSIQSWFQYQVQGS